MRNKKSLLSLCLLALVLVLGVGYAVVSAQDLTVSGTASTVDGGKMDVAFTAVGATPTINGTGVTASGEKTGDLTATITVSNLSAIGDSAELTYTLTNRETDLAATITEGEISVLATDSTTELDDYYRVTTTIPQQNVIAKDGGTMDVKIKVELVKLPIETLESTANITVGFVATPTQP